MAFLVCAFGLTCASWLSAGVCRMNFVQSCGGLHWISFGVIKMRVDWKINIYNNFHFDRITFN